MSAPSSPAIVAVVLADSPERIESSVAQVEILDLAPRLVVVAGNASPVEKKAKELGLRWVPEAAALRDELDPSVTHVWLLHDDVRLRPDTLTALHAEAERVEASVAGSKLLRADGRELESIGGLTDAFAHPTSVLEEGELDLGQYDVIRDVAYLPSASLLVRRDLFRGLGGIDRTLAPEAAGIDFAQRARLAGGRVVIIPSSEVVHDGACGEGVPAWRESAGQLRAVLKAYSLISLVWVLPAMVVNSLLAMLGAALVGHFGHVLDFLKAWAWNLKNVRSLLAGRKLANQARAVGDEELFRYQVRGSVLLGEIWAEIVDALRAPLSTSEAVLEWAEDRSTGRSAAVLGSGVLAWFVAIRAILYEGLPTGGWTLPLDPDWRSVMASYAGGWNAVGFGSDGPPHPSAALLAHVTRLLGESAAPTVTMVVVALGLAGGYRVLRALGANQWPALVGALLGVLGPAAAMLGSSWNWPGLLALGFLPWAIHGVLRPLPDGWAARIVLLVRAGLAAFLMVSFVPAAIAVPAGVGLLGGIFGLGWTGIVRGSLVSLLALPAVGPWGVWNSLDSLTAAGAPPAWTIPVWVSAGLVLMWVVSLDTQLWRLGAVAGALLGGGALLARGFLPGRELATAGVVTLAAGVLLAGGAAASRVSGGQGLISRMGASVALIAVLISLFPVGRVLASGTYGLDDTGTSAERLRYLVARDRGVGERVLFIASELPGDTTEWRGLPMAILDPEVSYTDAWRGREGPMEARLRADLDEFITEPGLRAGALFQEYGLGWIVSPPDSPLASSLRGRLDVIELTFEDASIFEYVGTAPVARAVTGAWRHDGTTWVGPAAPTVTLRINPTRRFTSEDGAFRGTTGALSAVQDPVLAGAARLSSGFLVVLAVGSLFRRRRT